MNTVFVVHCIDTEGPLYEAMTETFKRLKPIFDIDIKPTKENLVKLQKGQIDLGGLEDAVKKVVDPHLLNYLDTWDKIDEMLDRILSIDFRNKFPDSKNNGWIYNCHCLDHVYYNKNPRRRDIVFHNIFDHYRDKLSETESKQDGLQFHFHPAHPYHDDATMCATHWFASSNHLFETLSRRIIERKWFPSVNRPGFHVNRPDSHWFLEQYIPFDYANQSIPFTDFEKQQLDLINGRGGDWRKAPRSWVPYHPSHDNYQKPGECRRWIARCLNIGTRLRLLNEEEVRLAFEESKNGKPVILSFTNHDFRDISKDIAETYDMIKNISNDYENVNFEYADGITAFRKAFKFEKQEPCDLNVSIEKIGDETHLMRIKSSNPTFGPQPFFCYKTKTEGYYHDNLDFEKTYYEWTYTFDKLSAPLSVLDQIGLATNNSYGITTVLNIDIKSGDITSKYWNEPNS